MLDIPDKKIARSIKKHNSDKIVVADWIESNVLFLNENVSQSDVLDILIENQIYSDQDFASNFTDIIWGELQRRSTYIGAGYPFQIRASRVEKKDSWDKFSAYSFCLILSLSSYYNNFKVSEGGDYGYQGELFESLSKDAMENHLQGWDILQTGWSRSNPQKFEELVNEICAKVGDNTGNIDLWNDPNAKEKGVDLLCYKTFLDQRTGIPIYLMQCASGSNWDSKVKEPDLELWKNVISFTSDPNRAFSTAFVCEDRLFEQNSILVNGLFFDRCRLLGVNQLEEEWIDNELRENITDFVDGQLPKLPELEYDI